MRKFRHALLVTGMLMSLASCTSQPVSVGVGIGTPHASIGFYVPAYPRLAAIPGYPVYYAPYIQANFFFYDGLYWVYQNDLWYSSSWYNGPWWVVEPRYVPAPILRVPVRYYRKPPHYFSGWRADAPPRWNEHWGREWEQRRSGWDKAPGQRAPAAAPAPVYQQRYSGREYPRQVERQRELHEQNYRYQPRDPLVRQRYQEEAMPALKGQKRNP